MPAARLLVLALICLPAFGGWGQPTERRPGTSDPDAFRCILRGRCVNCDYYEANLRGPVALFPCTDFRGVTRFIHAHFLSPADFELAQFHSSADFRGSQFHSSAFLLNARFDSMANFGDVKFHSAANFFDARFYSKAIFFAVEFCSKAFFLKSHFNSTVDFRVAKFRSDANFSEVEFHSEANLIGARFDSTATFFMAEFYSEADFGLVQFQSMTDFGNTQFHSMTDFRGAQFHSAANFGGSKFLSTTVFSVAHFHSTANFGLAHFHSTADFSGAEFKKKPDFTQSTLPTTLIFSSVNLDAFSDKLDLRGFVLGSLQRAQSTKCRLYLDGVSPTNLAKIIVPFSKFELAFPYAVRESNRLTRYPFEEKETIYEALIKSCKDAGMMESVEGWSIEYEKLQIRHNFEQYPWLGETWICLQEMWWNFGYAKWKILFLWLPFFFLLFVLINYWTLASQLRKLYFDPEIGQNHRDERIDTPAEMVRYLSRNRLRKFTYALHYTGVVYFGFKVKHEALNFQSLGWVLYFYFMFVVGILHLAFSFNYIVSQ